jgi:N-acetyl-beta-hexosaminidase
MIAGLELHLAPPEVEILAAADSFEDELAVSMSSDAEAAIIRYTLDGSDPTAKSARYVRPLILVETTTVRAAAFLDGKRSLLPATWTATRRP